MGELDQWFNRTHERKQVTVFLAAFESQLWLYQIYANKLNNANAVNGKAKIKVPFSREFNN